MGPGISWIHNNYLLIKLIYRKNSRKAGSSLISKISPLRTQNSTEFKDHRDPAPKLMQDLIHIVVQGTPEALTEWKNK